MRNRHEPGMLFNIASYARRGPGQRMDLTRAQLELIQRTASRTPEVMVKVLGRGGHDLKSVSAHLAYLSREGELDLETDEGRPLRESLDSYLVNDWNLDIDQHRPQRKIRLTDSRRPPKLVHKLVFSMPPGTPPDKVLAATRKFAREVFALKHRFALVLHTDEPHPHVHLVLKALDEHGRRLNINKATLREWRNEFARHLRELGVAANATERAVRGQKGHTPGDGRYRAEQRGHSTYGWLGMYPLDAEHKTEEARQRIRQLREKNTQDQVAAGWQGVLAVLEESGQFALAERVSRFTADLPNQRKQRVREISERTR